MKISSGPHMALRKVDEGRMGDQRGDESAPELDILASPLMDAVVDVEGLELGGLVLKPPDVFRVQQVGQDQVAFHLQVLDAFPQGHPGPIGVDDAVFLFEHVSLFSRGNRSGSAGPRCGPSAGQPKFTRRCSCGGEWKLFWGSFKGREVRWRVRAGGRSRDAALAPHRISLRHTAAIPLKGGVILGFLVGR